MLDFPLVISVPFTPHAQATCAKRPQTRVDFDWSNKTKASINEMLLSFIHRAVNSENDKVNNIKNQLTGEYGAVPDTARDYKVNYIK